MAKRRIGDRRENGVAAKRQRTEEPDTPRSKPQSQADDENLNSSRLSPSYPPVDTVTARNHNGVKRSSPELRGHDGTSSPAEIPDPPRIDGTEQYAYEDEDYKEEYDRRPVKTSTLTVGYLNIVHSVNLEVLDFDVERTCSETLAIRNVYLCLVCGKYFQGKGQNTPAYKHALSKYHHIFMSMTSDNRKVWALPDNYLMRPETKIPFPKVQEPLRGWRDDEEEKAMEKAVAAARWTLADVQWQVEPKQTKQELLRLDTTEVLPKDIFDHPYRPGFIGIINLRESAYANVVIHALNHILPIRDYFLLGDLGSPSALVKHYVMLLRKVWNPRALQAKIAPHEFFHEVGQRSEQKFSHEKAKDPAQFLAFMLHNLHVDIGGTKKNGSSIIYKTIQGMLQMEVQQIISRADKGDGMRFEAGSIKEKDKLFQLLPLDLPPMPVFKTGRGDAMNIPQVSIEDLLSQYNGETSKTTGSERMRFRLKYPPPPYLIFSIKRFVKNDFGRERNSTIVTFNPNGLDLKPFIIPGPWRVGGDAVEYDLVANITHETVSTHADTINADVSRDVWRVQLRDRPAGTWRLVDNVRVTEVQEELLYLQESYIQVWEHRKVAADRAAAMREYLQTAMQE